MTWINNRRQLVVHGDNPMSQERMLMILGLPFERARREARSAWINQFQLRQKPASMLTVRVPYKEIAAGLGRITRTRNAHRVDNYLSPSRRFGEGSDGAARLREAVRRNQ